MYFSILVLPIIACFTSLFSRFTGSKSPIIITLIHLLNTLFSFFVFYEILFFASAIHLPLFEWFSVGLFSSYFLIFFDSITASMTFLVCFVSFIVHLFSLSYMRDDPHINRFFCYLSLFTFFMILLVVSTNLLVIFIGWEGVGLCSFLLISFWQTRTLANKAAIKALIVNRIGDLGFLLAMFSVYFSCGTIDFLSLLVLQPATAIPFFFIVLAAVGKSAQLSLHIWLPDAMEGPTPVSALIHAATMVTAGIYLILRLIPLFPYIVLYSISILGTITLFFASIIGLTVFDMKKVIAYSTCSQLGYMLMVCSTSSPSNSLYHLLNHGFFKALLFLGAGSLIHAVHHEQSVLRFGYLIKSLPMTYVCFLIGTLALTGFPFFSGFFSKDLLLEAPLNLGNFAPFLLATFSAILTAIYSWRVISLCFYNHTQSYTVNENHSGFIIPLLFLAVNSVVFGYYFEDIFLGTGSPFLFLNSNWTYVEILPFYLNILPVLGAILGSLIGYKIYTSIYIHKDLYVNSSHLGDQLYYKFCLPILEFGKEINYKLIDNGILILRKVQITRLPSEDIYLVFLMIFLGVCVLSILPKINEWYLFISIILVTNKVS